MITRTLDNGTTITVQGSVHGPTVYCDNPQNDSPEPRVVGRLVPPGGCVTASGFQPAIFPEFTLSAETLRAIADVLDEVDCG